MINWESTSIHKDPQIVLSVYVDDFKMAGPVDITKKAWPVIRGVISMDEPTSLGAYLGCGHKQARLSVQRLYQSFNGTGSVVVITVSHFECECGRRPPAHSSAGGDSEHRRGCHSGGGRIPGLRCEMTGFMEQCVEGNLELASIPRAKLNAASTPSLEERSIASKDFEGPDYVSSIATKVLMNILYAARVDRLDLLQSVTALAREVSRWNRTCDKQLFRLGCYINSRLKVNLISHLGDPVNQYRPWLFSDLRFAGGTRSPHTLRDCSWPGSALEHSLRLPQHPKGKQQCATALRKPRSSPLSRLVMLKDDPHLTSGT